MGTLTFFHFCFIQLIYSIAATRTCKIITKNCYWKKYFTILPLLFGKVGSFLWTGCGFWFSILWYKFLTLLNTLLPLHNTTVNDSKTQINYFLIASSAWRKFHMALFDLNLIWSLVEAMNISAFFIEDQIKIRMFMFKITDVNMHAEQALFE